MNIIKELMLRKGVQQKELAIAIGVSQPTISDWVRGTKKPAGDNIRKLAGYFDVSQDVIKGLDPIPLNIPGETPSTRKHSGLADALLTELLDEDEDVGEFLEAIFRDPERKKLFKRSAKSGIDEVREANAILDALKNTRNN